MPTGRKHLSARALTFVLMVVAAAATALAILPRPALAGTYTVTACEAAPDGHANNSWWQSNTAFGYYTTVSCPSDGAGARQGMLAISGLNANVGNVPLRSAGWTRFDAPAGTTIANVHLNYDGRSQFPNGGWSSFIASSDNGFQGSIGTGNPHFDYLDGCTAYAFCSFYANDRYWDLPSGTTSISATIQCEAGGGCATGSSGAYVALHSATVTLQDNSAPTLSNGRGLWGNSNWVHGTEYVGFDATDVSGVKVAAIEIDPGTPQGMTAAADTRPCDYTYAVPCPRQGIATDFDTSRLSDGAHTLRLVAEDAAGNWNTADTTIYTDNHAPARTNLSLDGGETWRTQNEWTLRWTNPAGQTSDITGTHWKVCPTNGGACWTINSTLANHLGGQANVRADDLGITQPGDYTVQLYLEDQAGNTDPNAASDPLHLKFDNVPPADAQPAHANGWLNAQEAASYREPIQLASGTPPVSGIAGYAVTTDGSDPGMTINAPAPDPTTGRINYLINDLPEGHNTIRARAISGAGLGSPSVQSVDIPVDRTPPTVSADGAPDSTVWQNHDVGLKFSGVDQPTLSGMGAAAPAQPMTAGAYVSYSVDGGPEQQVRGDTALATIATDGVHHITYQAYDLAGNPSTRHTIDLRVDKTAPEFVAFENQDPNSPTRVSVAASDRTSGLADGGVIQLRLVTPLLAKRAWRYQRATGCSAATKTTRCRRVMRTVRKQLDAAATSDWKSLPTGRSGDHYNAEITAPAAPTAGLYEFRAIVPDQAGNTAIGTTTRRGDPVERSIDPAKLDGTGGSGTGQSGTDGVHCFGCPSYPTATVATKLTAGLVKTAAKTPRKKTAKKRPHKTARGAAKRKRRRKAPSRAHTRAPRDQLVRSLLVGFGKAAAAKGTLRYGSGQAILGVTVDVYARLDAAGAKWTHIAVVRTDAAGAFSYRAPAGPSRAIGFRYDGNERDKAAEAMVSLKVPAATTIRASKRRLRVGQTLTLRGQLQRVGAPVPPAGKLVVLEAFDRRRWRKFATARTTKSGAWRYRYRFVATSGTVIYPMRAVVERESSYAFETGPSKVVHVTVKGR